MSNDIFKFVQINMKHLLYMLKIMGKKVFTILRYFCFVLSKPVKNGDIKQL